MTSSQIISGYSHSFDSGVAIHLGINAAVIYNHIVYWLKTNASKKDAKMIEGKYWMYETMQQMADFLGYLSLDEIKKAMAKLIESGLLIKGCFNSNPFDRTAWYTVPDQSIIKKTLTKVPIGTITKCQPALSESANPHFGECATAPCIYTTEEEQENTNIEQQQQTEQEGQSVVCSSSVVSSFCSDLSSPSDPIDSIDSDPIDPILESKAKAFNWFVKLGCDVISATSFVEKFSLEDIKEASIYVGKQIKKKKEKGEKIANIVAYLRKTLEGKWWIPQQK